VPPKPCGHFSPLAPQTFVFPLFFFVPLSFIFMRRISNNYRAAAFLEQGFGMYLVRP
jgi:hypothetical protein